MRYGIIKSKSTSTLLTSSFSKVSVTLKELGLDNPAGYHIEDLYDEHVYGVVTPDRRFKVDVNPSGSKCL